MTDINEELSCVFRRKCPYHFEEPPFTPEDEQPNDESVVARLPRRHSIARDRSTEERLVGGRSVGPRWKWK